MVKHTQTIRRQIADELFECVWPLTSVFEGLLQNLLNKKMVISGGGHKWKARIFR